MHFLTSYYWESGRRTINQDSIAIQSVTTKKGPMLMACVCDGLGGLEQGEIASGYLVEQITDWFYNALTRECQCGACGTRIRKSGYRLFYSVDQELKMYAKRKNIQLGSTMTMLLLVQRRYYIFHIGDSRAYRIQRQMKQMTQDHTWNEYTLTRCVGSGIWDRPDCTQGFYRKNDSFLLCTDGFRHYISKDILQTLFRGTQIRDEKEAYRRMKEVGTRNIERGEKDNISAIYIKVL